MTWDWPWIEAKYRVGNSAARIAFLYKAEFGDGPSRSTIRRRATNHGWTTDLKDAVKKQRDEFDANRDAVDAAIATQALVELNIIQLHRKDLIEKAKILEKLWSRVDEQISKPDLDAWTTVRLASAFRAAMACTRELHQLERIAHGLDAETGRTTDERTQELNQHAIRVAARHLDGQYGEVDLEGVLTCVHGVHVPELPNGLLPPADGDGDAETASPGD